MWQQVLLAPSDLDRQNYMTGYLQAKQHRLDDVSVCLPAELKRSIPVAVTSLPLASVQGMWRCQGILDFLPCCLVPVGCVTVSYSTRMFT